MKFTVARKLTVMVTVVVIITSVIIGYSVSYKYDNLLTRQEMLNMGVNAGEEAAEIATTLKRMSEDVIFLSSTPPIRGLMRTTVNNGIDYLDGSSQALWKKRLTIIFRSFLESKHLYQSIQYIGVANNGKELVRVERINGEISSYINRKLRQEGNSKYYKTGISLGDKKIHLSDIEYIEEQKGVTGHGKYIMHAVTPVFTQDKKIFGMVVVSINADYLFKSFLKVNRAPEIDQHRFVTDNQGEILNLGQRNSQTATNLVKLDEAPAGKSELKDFLLNSEQLEVIKEVRSNNLDRALFCKKLFYDKNDNSRFIVLVEQKPYETVIANANEVKKFSLFLILLLILPVILIATMFSDMLTRPLRQIAGALDNFRKNRSAFSLQVNTKDEIGALAKAFREMVDDLNKAQEQLIQSEKMASIGQLAAGVAHEINNPVGFLGSNINSLKSYCDDFVEIVNKYETMDELLKKDPASWEEIDKTKKKVDLEYLKKDVSKLIAESKDGVKRVKEIVQNLKDFSHVDEAEWQYANIHEGLDSTLNIVNNEIKYKAEVIKLYGKLPDIECIASQLNQVFMNLLVNAAHSIDVHGTITVETGVSDSNWVWISISDTGKGIPKELQKRIFDPFFTTKPIGQGTGLGLSLSYGIIEKHSGRIECTSTEGVGTRFSIWLPIKQDKVL